MPVITGACKYPEGIVETLKEKAEVISLDALGLSMSLGSSKAVNVVLIGVLAKSTDIDKETWYKIIKETVPPKFLDLNLKAFDLGYNF
jgi:indolepyruvate ferredoxin oxidoreductase beta subunit